MGDIRPLRLGGDRRGLLARRTEPKGPWFSGSRDAGGSGFPETKWGVAGAEAKHGRAADIVSFAKDARDVRDLFGRHPQDCLDDTRCRRGSRRIRLTYDLPIPAAVRLRFCRERGFASVGSHDPLVATPVLERHRDADDEDGRRIKIPWY